MNLSSTIFDHEGNLVLEGTDPVTVQTLFKRALLADHTGDGKPIPSNEKFSRYELYNKLRDTEVALNAQERALLEGAVKVYPTWVAGELLSFLAKN